MSTREDFEAWAKGVDLPLELDEHECFVDARVGIAANAYQAATSHQEAKIKALVEALEKLACLGNGDKHGNSIGNRIAQKAVADIKQALSRQEHPSDSEYKRGFADGQKEFSEIAGGDWQTAVIDQLVVHHIYQAAHDTDPRKAIHDLLCMNQSIALDPQVSSDAQALIDRGRKEAQQEQPAQGKCKCGHVGTSITVVESFPVHSVSVDEEDPDYKEHYYGLDVDATLQIGLEICRNCKTINGFWIEDTGGAEFYADWGKPRYTHPAPTQPAQEPVAWEGAEGWEPLAWHLCAEENGEEACTELIWEGGPIPEPWGDRWLKYEHEAKQMIATVKKYAPPTQPALTQEQAEKLAHRRATTYTHRSDPKFTAYAFTPLHLMDFVGDIEAHLKGQK